MDLVKLDDTHLLVVECLFSRFAETYRSYLLAAKAAEGVDRSKMLPTVHRARTELSTLGAESSEFEWGRSAPHTPPTNGPGERLNGNLINESVRRGRRGHGVVRQPRTVRHGLRAVHTCV